MERLIESSPELRSVSDLSTVLVATIEEAKERISQIEYLFCDQLYPKFQLKSKNFTKWEEKENDFLLQIERLSCENESKRVKIADLESNLLLKNKEFDEILTMHNNLLLLVNSKSSEIDEKVRRLKEKTEEADKGNELARTLFTKIELQGSEIMRNEEEIQILTEKLQQLERTVCQLRLINKEVSSKGDEMKKLYEESEREKKQLLGKVDELRDLSGRTATELETVKRNRVQYVGAYKRLKSSYNFLLKQSGHSVENMITPPKLQDDESDSLSKNRNQTFTSPGLEDIAIDICDKTKLECKIPADSNSDDERKRVTTVKTSTLGGKKRPASNWRDTRTHQGKNGPDPHDDFLDTPLENLRGNIINKAVTREEPRNVRALIPKEEENVDNSDDETQDLNAVKKPQTDQGKCFKFVGPVRKKAERENLKGVECQQCKKFYDAVLCNEEGNNNGKDGNNSKVNNLRCEHHEGVSRHRYRYVPPMTPEGFWNIGFESEI